MFAAGGVELQAGSVDITGDFSKVGAINSEDVIDISKEMKTSTGILTMKPWTDWSKKTNFINTGTSLHVIRWAAGLNRALAATTATDKVPINGMQRDIAAMDRWTRNAEHTDCQRS
ncbi:unnamed protein product [Gongylonema pulchrum]|uniref:Phage major capsid protein n=1 Tax=Gongylonema pulchrum TaxID=637853 RepID=A0A183E310_9BILA|nr:unnamed protein product [Gongylonema pulchrum]